MEATDGVAAAKFPFYIPLFSRLFILLFAIFADNLVADHTATDVATLLASDQACLWCFLKPFTRWDAVYYLNIAKYGYVHESQYAFFPLFPYCIRFVAHLLEYINKGASAVALPGNDINYYVIAGLIISNLSFVISSWLLWQIFSTSEKSIKNLILLLFNFNPGNVFFSTVYTESLYALFTFSNVLVLEKYSNIYVSLLIVTLSAFVRSNGVFNGILLILHVSKGQLLRHQPLTVRFVTRIIMLVLFLYFLMSYTCNLGAVDICSNSDSAALTCSSSHFVFEDKVFYNTYQLIQFKHWGVGFFSYYQIKNIPNFLLASPMVCICAYIIHSGYKTIATDGYYKYLQNCRAFNMVYMAALLGLIVVYAHVQIVTRVICSSCPYLYLEVSLLLAQNKRSKVAIISYFLMFNIVGVFMHSNHYPWT